MPKVNRKVKKSSKKKQNASNLRYASVVSRRQAGTGSMRNMGIMSAAMGVCSITNPFCDEAFGARWPDNSNTKSVSYDFRSQTTIGATASGKQASLYLPSLNGEYLAAASLSGVFASFTGTPAPPNGVTATAGPARWRLTSYGIKITCLQSKMVAKGLLRVRLYSPISGTMFTTTDIGSIYADKSIDLPLSSLIEKPLFVIPMPLGDNARFYQNYAAPVAIANFVNPGWQCIQVALDGAEPDLVAISVEAFYHYEIVYDDGSSLQLFASAPPANNATARNAAASTVESVGNFFEGAATTLDNIFQSKAAKYIGGALGWAMGGPSTAMVAYNGVNTRQQRHPWAPMVD